MVPAGPGHDYAGVAGTDGGDPGRSGGAFALWRGPAVRHDHQCRRAACRSAVGPLHSSEITDGDLTVMQITPEWIMTRRSGTRPHSGSTLARPHDQHRERRAPARCYHRDAASGSLDAVVGRDRPTTGE